MEARCRVRASVKLPCMCQVEKWPSVCAGWEVAVRMCVGEIRRARKVCARRVRAAPGSGASPQLPRVPVMARAKSQCVRELVRASVVVARAKSGTCEVAVCARESCMRKGAVRGNARLPRWSCACACHKAVVCVCVSKCRACPEGVRAGANARASRSAARASGGVR